ncbi:MAG: hypothetical protein ACYCWW_05890, partial [Deltaproteobacteria bacterium]
RDLLSRYVPEGPGQLLVPLPGPPEPGMMPVGQIVPVVLAFRDRELRIPVRCRVLGVRNDGNGHWRAQLEFASVGEARQALGAGGRPSKDYPHVRVTLSSGERADAAIVRLEPDRLELDAPVAAEDGEVVQLSVRGAGRLVPLRLAGEVRRKGNRFVIELLFKEPREELAWTRFVALEAERAELRTA